MYNKERKKKYLKEYRLKNREHTKEYDKKRYLKKRKHIKELAREYHLKNKERIKERMKEYYLKNKERRKEYSKEYHLKNKERAREYRLKNKEKRRIHENKRMKTDLNYKFRKALGTRISQALKGLNKSKRTMELLGCTIEELWTNIESQFKKGMTRENHGQWHIDHIKPCASFDLTDPKQQEQCFHYSNLQPLWALENLSKGATINKGDKHV